ncbi:MAG TPA: CoA pyrophosphatase [Devosia sp.]|nr:CoA pyrophosphatase [Devosia sp.]
MHDDAFLVHIGGKLLDRPKPIEGAQLLVPDWLPDVPFSEPPVPAAVLIALVARPGGRSLLFTQRSLGLRSHSGQVSFPGGKIDEGDADAGAAALREAREEVGLNPNNASILGYMEPYQTGTNYVITPVVAVVEQEDAFVANPKEVDEVFEVPLAYAARARNYSRFVVRRNNIEHSTWQLDYGGHMIWGITANLTRHFRDLALQELDI